MEGGRLYTFWFSQNVQFMRISGLEMIIFILI